MKTPYEIQLEKKVIELEESNKQKDKEIIGRNELWKIYGHEVRGNLTKISANATLAKLKPENQKIYLSSIGEIVEQQLKLLDLPRLRNISKEELLKNSELLVLEELCKKIFLTYNLQL